MYDYLDNNLLDRVQQKVTFLEKKTAFKNYLENDLGISGPVLERLLLEFDEGLNSNIDFRMLMFALGYKEDLIDDIISTFNAGERKTPHLVDESLKKTSSIIDEVAKSNIKNPSFEYITTPNLIGKTCKFKEKAQSLITTIHKSNISTNQKIDKSSYEENLLYIGQPITISETSRVYNNVLDMGENKNGFIPDYNFDVPRIINAVVLVFQGEFIICYTPEELDRALATNAKIIGALTSVDGKTEGIYSINDIKRGVTR